VWIGTETRHRWAWVFQGCLDVSEYFIIMTKWGLHFLNDSSRLCEMDYDGCLWEQDHPGDRQQVWRYDNKGPMVGSILQYFSLNKISPFFFFKFFSVLKANRENGSPFYPQHLRNAEWMDECFSWARRCFSS
jgi:hypothetical protein